MQSVPLSAVTLDAQFLGSKGFLFVITERLIIAQTWRSARSSEMRHDGVDVR